MTHQSIQTDNASTSALNKPSMLKQMLDTDAGFPVVGEFKNVYKRYLTVSHRKVQYPSKVIVDWDVVGWSVDTPNPNFCVVFIYHSATKTATLLLEYQQGINKIRYGMVSGGYEPEKHKSILHCAQAELAEEAHLTGGTWVYLLPEGSEGVGEVKWCANRFMPLLVIDPVVNPTPPERDAEEMIEVVSGITMDELDELMVSGKMMMTAVQTAVMAKAWLKKNGHFNAHVAITGASGGVGIPTAELFLEAGAKVSLHYNTNAKTLQPLLEKYPNSAYAIQASVTSESDITRFYEQASAKFGVVTTLVVCHGIWPTEDVGVKDMSLERWKNTIAVNLDGTFLFCREYLKRLEVAVNLGAQLHNVAIVMVGSTAGKFGEAWHADYSVTKSSMMYGLTLSLKNEIVKIHPRGRVNTVSPGWIRTPMAERAMQDPALLYQALASSPLKKVSEPEDIARAIFFLSSEKMSGNITGISLDLNAGMEGRLLNKPHDF
ncbi:hypothetical protein HDU76_002306 [Blyttiomyces sp. JEL0837]|nr:hypothetical protein HDU76_002306 [Blyttiomyces sp. JEL0837]